MKSKRIPETTKKSYLFEQFAEFQAIYPNIVQQGIFRDSWGIFAISFTNKNGEVFYFVAKKSDFQGYVSINNNLHAEALRHKNRIVMSLCGEFYLIDPKRISYSEPYVNEYHRVKMINFELKKVAGDPLPKPTNNEVSKRPLSEKDLNHPGVKMLVEQMELIPA